MKQLLILIFAAIITISCVKHKETPTPSLTEQKNAVPKNIILMIGDGMGIAQIYAGMTAQKDRLEISRCKHIGFSKTYSADDYITDSAAGGTALACGVKTNNGYIGVDTNKVPVKSILEIAESKNMATGLVATAAITHATPASFIAHHYNRNDYERIALDFLKTDIDVFIGGGRNHFQNREDNLNLIDSLVHRGYQIIDTFPKLAQTNSDKIAGLMYAVHPPMVDSGRGNMLEESALKALEILSKNNTGFFMMVEGSQIDWGGHSNRTEYVVNEMVDFDKTVGKVLDFAEKDKNTLVIITADHECGGFSVTDGCIKTGKVTAMFNTEHHTGEPVPVFAFGPSSEKFQGFYNNTDIFKKMLSFIED